MKKRGGEPLAAGLAELLHHRERDWFESTRIDAIVPVPHHWWDRVRHPHLTPATLARGLASRLGKPVAGNIVTKVRRTRPQAQLVPSERRKNLIKAFRAAGRPRIEGLSLLVVDDVLTTGETAHRVARALRDAGAKSISVAVIARGIGVK
jgi:predicted amidophosphoribosyltransferase